MNPTEYLYWEGTSQADLARVENQRYPRRRRLAVPRDFLSRGEAARQVRAARAAGAARRRMVGRPL